MAVAEREEIKKKAREKARVYQAAWNEGEQRSIREIGPLPEIVNPKRREECRDDLERFLVTYFPEQFYMGLSADHRRVIQALEDAIRTGGLFAVAMPRGAGKTTICEGGCIYAVNYGFRRFPVMVGATAGHAEQLLDSVKSEYENSELMLEDFPEICYPIQKLDGIARRADGQLLNGKRTMIDWKNKVAIMPTVDGSLASGTIIGVKGIDGAIRGMKFKRADGSTARPDLCIIDDPQTKESARSMSQSVYRESVISGDIIGLAGPGKKIAAVMPCTVIAPGDMADRMLNRKTHPEWHGVKTRMMDAMPNRLDLWETYSEMRKEGLRGDDKGAAATEYYAANRAAMDEGAKPAWEDRFEPGEISAVQSAMNIYFRDPAVFAAEYQNDPLEESKGQRDLTAEQICTKLNMLKRGIVPLAATHLTMFVDIQAKILYYTVCAWQDNFTGYVVEYGAWPDQRRLSFTANDPPVTLAKATGAGAVEACIHAGLIAIHAELVSRDWKREDGTGMKIERCMVDANWGQSTETVYDICRRIGGVMMPAHGRYVGASSSPLNALTTKPGDRKGLEWRIPAKDGKRAVQHVLFDVNFWKSFVVQRLGLAIGNPGAMMLFQAKQQQHEHFAAHLLAETRTVVEAKGRKADEWRLPSNRPDNHWFDCLVGCAVGASTLGVRSVEAEAKAEPRNRLKLSDIQREKRYARS
jgi:hypothetical protein